MKQRKVAKIDDKEITLKELSVKDLLYVCHRTGWVGTISGIDFEKDFNNYKSMSIVGVILKLSSDISIKELLVLAPSEIKKLYDIFVEINEVTFSVAKYLGVGNIMEDVKRDLVSTFLNSYSNFMSVSSSKQTQGKNSVKK